MKRLLTAFFLAALVASAQVPTANVLIDLAGANTGDTINSTIAAAGTQGTGGTWTIDASSFTVADSIGNLTNRVNIGGSYYNINNASKAWKYDCANANKQAKMTIASGKRVASVSWLMKLGPPNQGSGSQLWDLMKFKGIITGYGVVCQLNNGNFSNPGTYTLNIETHPGGVTTHTGSITVVPNTGIVYQLTLKTDLTNGVSSLYVYNFNDGTQVGTITNAPTQTGEDIESVIFGNTETGNVAGGYYVYFQNILIDWTNANQPLVPPVPVSPDPAVVSSATAAGSTSATIIAFTAATYNSPVTYSVSTDAGSTWSSYQSSASFAVSGLTPSTTYHSQVKVKDNAGNVTGASASTDFTTNAPPSPQPGFSPNNASGSNTGNPL